MNNIILDRTIPKEAAERYCVTIICTYLILSIIRLSSLSSEMYQSVPDLDVVNYLAIPNASPISVLTFILKLFSENLGGTLTSFCFSDTTAKQHKVCLLISPIYTTTPSSWFPSRLRSNPHALG